ncbi:metallophosphoesterase [soil metagenome]
MTQNSAPRFTRRRLLKLVGGLTLGAASVAAYTRVLEPRWVDIEQIPLTIPGLPEKLIGKRIAQMSDIHLSQFFAPERLLAAVATVNALAPDWLFLTGDYVGSSASAAAGLIEPLRQLQMPTFVSFGNHDYWSDIHVVKSMLAETPAICLQNAGAQLADNLWVAGVDDVWSGYPDLKAALRSVPAKATTLLLAHEPDFFDQVIEEQAPVAVQFSGHSHGGQVRLPVLNADADGRYTYAPVLPPYGRNYPIGLHKNQQRQVYTNRGLGVWPLPMRFNCRPEISIFTLLPTS